MGAAPQPSADSEIPRQGRLLGLDYGTKRLGLALSNAEQTIATPLETYLRRDEKQDTRHLVQRVQEYRAVGLIVGLPVHAERRRGGKGPARPAPSVSGPDR